MESYKFTFEDKSYELGEGNFDGFINDEEKPVEGINEEDIINLLNGSEEVDFGVEYYEEKCPDCPEDKERKSRFSKFLEYHFYIFTLKGKHVISTISKEYENLSFKKLLKQGRVDGSYIVSVIVCVDCGSYTIELSQCEV